MGLSEHEIDARLTVLRSRRATIDREIADLLLYLELGRRLGGSDASPPAPSRPDDPKRSRPPSAPEADRDTAPPDHEISAADRSLAVHPPVPGIGERDKTIPPAVGVAQDVKAARRYGRALIESACAVLARAGRPLHAGEILERLVAEGFTVPGDDPVAALNTRLWKRATLEGPLRRLGDARYALAEPGAV